MQSSNDIGGEEVHKLLRLYRWYLRPRAATESAVGWWEKRRGAYNLFLFVWDLVLYFLALLIAWVHGRSIAGLDDSARQTALSLTISCAYLLPIIQVTANFWYTGGWMVELVISLFSKRHMGLFGPRALLAGTLFSFIFTLSICFWISAM